MALLNMAAAIDTPQQTISPTQAYQIGTQMRLLQAAQKYGPGLARGDQAAIDAYARIDPAAAMTAMSNRQQMRLREQLAERQRAEHEQTLTMNGLRIDGQGLSNASKQLELDTQRAAVVAKGLMYADSPEKWAETTEYLSAVGVPNAAEFPFEARDTLLGIFGAEPEYLTINNQLVDPRTREVIGDYRTPDNSAPTTKNVTGEGGVDTMVQWNPETEVWDPAPIPEGGTSAPDTRADLSADQRKLALFKDMQSTTGPILNRIEESYDPASLAAAIASNVPGGNFLRSEEGQIYEANVEAWSEGALRVSSGAGTSPQEIVRIRNTYFPQAGDKPATIEMKRHLRAAFEEAVAGSIGEADFHADKFALDFINNYYLERSGGGSAQQPSAREQIGRPDLTQQFEDTLTPEALEFFREGSN